MRTEKEIQEELEKNRSILAYVETVLKNNKKMTKKERELSEKGILIYKTTIQNLEWILGKNLNE